MTKFRPRTVSHSDLGLTWYSLGESAPVPDVHHVTLPDTVEVAVYLWQRSNQPWKSRISFGLQPPECVELLFSVVGTKTHKSYMPDLVRLVGVTRPPIFMKLELVQLCAVIKDGLRLRVDRERIGNLTPDMLDLGE